MSCSKTTQQSCPGLSDSCCFDKSSQTVRGKRTKPVKPRDEGGGHQQNRHKKHAQGNCNCDATPLQVLLVGPAHEISSLTWRRRSSLIKTPGACTTAHLAPCTDWRSSLCHRSVDSILQKKSTQTPIVAIPMHLNLFSHIFQSHISGINALICFNIAKTHAHSCFS